MVYGAEDVLPYDIHHSAPRVIAYSEAASTAALEDDVDALDEARDIALARSAVYQHNLRGYHSRRVRSRAFVEGDLVLRRRQKSHQKLESPWDGPYIIAEAILGGTYLLKDPDTGEIYANP